MEIACANRELRWWVSAGTRRNETRLYKIVSADVESVVAAPSWADPSFVITTLPGPLTMRADELRGAIEEESGRCHHGSDDCRNPLPARAPACGPARRAFLADLAAGRLTVPPRERGLRDYRCTARWIEARISMRGGETNSSAPMD